MTLPFADLQLLRPAWLLALVLLPLLAWAWRRRARRRSAWRAAVDPHLLPHLLERGGGRGGGWAEGIAVLCGLALLVLALAGPSWRAVPQPLQARAGALVVAVDLSSSVLASDLQPNRLVRARARIGELLAAFAGEVGLVAYADDAFVVSPLTPDAANVAVFLDALAPDIMPLDGQRAGRAIERAAALLEQAGHGRGDILLLAPTADEAAVLAAGAAMARGYRVSVLAMGTAAGAGYRDREGRIHRSALEPAMLAAVATAGGGRVHAWDEAPGQVVAALGRAGTGHEGGSTPAHGAGLVREDGGFWLLPPALLLLLFAFRRGGVLALLVLGLLAPPPPVLAAGQEAPAASLWRRADQAAHARSAAAERAYREGDFDAAARGFAGVPGADAAYNRGNALARAGRYEEAIAAYDEALSAEPGMPDALANRAAVQAAMRRGPPPPGGARDNDRPPDGGDDGQGAGRSDSGQGADGRAAPDDRTGRAPEDDATAPAAPPEGRDEDAAAPPPTSDDAGPGDDAGQDAADAAQREAMQRALEAGGDDVGGQDAGERPRASAASPEDSAAEEREQANAAWLRRVPDDPGALLRARFRNEHLRRRAGER